MEKDINSMWNDDGFGKEFVKFTEADNTDTILYDDDVSVLYCKPFYDTIEDTINQWNKKRKSIVVNLIHRAYNTPFESDEIENNTNLFLDMGARLFNAMKESALLKWKYVKVLKISSKTDKFDVHYYASEYKLILTKQKKLTSGKKK